MNITIYKTKLKKAREMLINQTKNQNYKRVKQIEQGIINLRNKIKELRLNKKTKKRK